MHFKNNLSRLMGALLLILGLCSALSADNVQSLPASEVTLQFNGQDNAVDQVNSRGTFAADLKLYVVEPDGGRWNDATSTSFQMSCMDFAFDSVLNLTFEEQFNRYIDWTPNFSGVEESNVMVIAVLFDRNVGYPASSDTGIGHNHPFTAYYTDAAVACTPGEVDTANSDTYTHTVFLEYMASSS